MPVSPYTSRERTNDRQLEMVEPLARDLLRLLTRDPARPFFGQIQIRLTVQDGVIQTVSGRYKGEARPASVTAAALNRAA